MFNLHKETYNIDGNSVTAVADFAANTLRIMARGFNQEYSLDEYTHFEGNMQEFAASKVST